MKILVKTIVCLLSIKAYDLGYQQNSIIKTILSDPQSIFLLDNKKKFICLFSQISAKVQYQFTAMIFNLVFFLETSLIIYSAPN